MDEIKSEVDEKWNIEKPENALRIEPNQEDKERKIEAEVVLSG